MEHIPELLIELILELTGVTAEALADITDESGIFEGNKDYTSKELMDGVKYGTDIYKKDLMII